MCIEKEQNKNNYTAQILLRKVGEDDLAQRIDDMLADKFICYYDNFDVEKIGGFVLAGIYMNRLCSPYEKVNLDYIMCTV